MPSKGLSDQLCACGCGEFTLQYANGVVSKFRLGHATRTKSGSQASGYRHGMSGTPTWHSWSNMVNRCTQEKNPAYPSYGGRGIAVCDRWLGKDGFANFLADMGEKPPKLTLERIDNEAGYSPSNCRWATRKEQALNTRNVHLSEKDVTWVREHPEMTRGELARLLGVSTTTISNIRNRKGRFSDPS